MKIDCYQLWSVYNQPRESDTRCPGANAPADGLFMASASPFCFSNHSSAYQHFWQRVQTSKSKMLAIQVKQLLPYCCYQHFLEFPGQSIKTAWLKKLLNISVDQRYVDLAVALSNHPPDRCTDLSFNRWFHMQCQHSNFSYVLVMFAYSKLFLCSQSYPILLSLTYRFLRNVNLTVFLSPLPFSSFHIYCID